MAGKTNGQLLPCAAVALTLALLGCGSSDEPAEPTLQDEPQASPEPDPETVAVPDVVGMSLDDARTAMRDVGLNVRRSVTHDNEGQDPNTVVRTQPAGGSEVDPGTDVRVIVAAEPTPEPGPPSRATQKQALTQAIEDNRVAMAEDLEGNVAEIETVDLFTFSPDTDTIQLAASSRFNGEEYHHDGAWAAARLLAGLYESLDVYQPIFDVRIDTAHYICPGHIMRDLQQRRLDRDGWRAACAP